MTREEGENSNENLRVGDDGDEAILLPCHLLHSSLMVLYTFRIVLWYFYRSIFVSKLLKFITEYYFVKHVFLP